MIVNPSHCPVVYSCLFNTGPRSGMCNVAIGSTTTSTFSNTSGDYSLTSTDFDPFPKDPSAPEGVVPGTYTFTILALSGSKMTTFSFTLIIGDPCTARPILLSITAHLFDDTKNASTMIDIAQDHYLNDPAINFPWEFSKIVTVDKQGVTYTCGDFSIQTFMDDGLETSLDTTIFAESTSGVTNTFSVIQTTDQSKVGNSYAVNYKAFMTLYPTLDTYSTAKYTVTIKDPCVAPPLVITQGSLVNQEYFLTASPKPYQLALWTTNNSFCTISYSYSSSAPGTLGSVISFDADPLQRRFVFSYSTDLVPSGSTFSDYTITVTGTVGSVTSQNTFQLKLKNPCTESTLNWIQIPATQPTYSYKIEDPQVQPSLSVLGGNLTPKIALCGPITFASSLISHATDPFTSSVTQSLTPTSTPVSFNSSTGIFTIQTNQKSWQGLHHIQLTAFLTNYPSVAITSASPVTLKLVFVACQVSVVTPQIKPENGSLTSPFQIKFGEDPLLIPIAEFITVYQTSATCSYTWADYTLVQTSLQTTPSSTQTVDFVQFDPNSKVLTLHAKEDTSTEFNLTLKITAQLSDLITIGETNEFEVIVSPSNTTYYVNNTAPQFDSPPQSTYTIYRDESQSQGASSSSNTSPSSSSSSQGVQIIDLGSISDFEGDLISVEFSCGAPNCPITYDKSTNQIIVPAQAPLGSYPLTITVSDDAPDPTGQSKSNTYQVLLSIAEIEQEQVSSNESVSEIDTQNGVDFSGANQSTTDPDLPPASFYIRSIDERGVMHIAFDQAMSVPANATHINQTVLDISLISENAEDPNIRGKQDFTWTLTEYRPNLMLVQLNFQHPWVISSNLNKDLIRVEVQNSSYFLSADQKSYIRKGTSSTKESSAQLKNEPESDLLLESIKSMKNGLQSVLGINFAVNLFLSGTLNFLWGLINCNQIIAFFPLLNLTMPANCQIFFQMIIKIVTFDFVDVLDEIRQIQTLLDIVPNKTEPLSPNFAIYEYDSLDTFTNLQQGLLFLLIFAMLPLVIKVIYLLLFWSPLSQGFIRLIEQKMYWNVYIRFILETYLELVIVSLMRIYMIDFSTKGDSVNTIFSFALFTGSAMLITLGILMFYSFREQLSDTGFKGKFGELYTSLDLSRKGSIMQPILFLLRRILYAMTLVLLLDYNGFQIHILILKMLSILSYNIRIDPFYSAFQNRLEIWNESILALAAYSLITLTEMVPNAETRYKNGWAMIAIIMCLLSINLFAVIFQTLKHLCIFTRKALYKYHMEKKRKAQGQMSNLQEIFRQKLGQDLEDISEESSDPIIESQASKRSSQIVEEKPDQLKSTDNFQTMDNLLLRDKDTTQTLDEAAKENYWLSNQPELIIQENEEISILNEQPQLLEAKLQRPVVAEPEVAKQSLHSLVKESLIKQIPVLNLSKAFNYMAEGQDDFELKAERYSDIEEVVQAVNSDKADDIEAPSTAEGNKTSQHQLLKNHQNSDQKGSPNDFFKETNSQDPQAILPINLSNSLENSLIFENFETKDRNMQANQGLEEGVLRKPSQNDLQLQEASRSTSMLDQISTNLDKNEKSDQKLGQDPSQIFEQKEQRQTQFYGPLLAAKMANFQHSTPQNIGNQSSKNDNFSNRFLDLNLRNRINSDKQPIEPFSAITIKDNLSKYSSSASDLLVKSLKRQSEKDKTIGPFIYDQSNDLKDYPIADFGGNSQKKTTLLSNLQNRSETSPFKTLSNQTLKNQKSIAFLKEKGGILPQKQLTSKLNNRLGAGLKNVDLQNKKQGQNGSIIIEEVNEDMLEEDVKDKRLQNKLRQENSNKKTDQKTQPQKPQPQKVHPQLINSKQKKNDISRSVKDLFNIFGKKGKSKSPAKIDPNASNEDIQPQQVPASRNQTKQLAETQLNTQARPSLQNSAYDFNQSSNEQFGANQDFQSRSNSLASQGSSLDGKKDVKHFAIPSLPLATPAAVTTPFNHFNPQLQTLQSNRTQGLQSNKSQFDDSLVDGDALQDYDKSEIPPVSSRREQRQQYVTNPKQLRTKNLTLLKNNSAIFQQEKLRRYSQKVPEVNGAAEEWGSENRIGRGCGLKSSRLYYQPHHQHNDQMGQKSGRSLELQLEENSGEHFNDDALKRAGESSLEPHQHTSHHVTTKHNDRLMGSQLSRLDDKQGSMANQSQTDQKKMMSSSEAVDQIREICSNRDTKLESSARASSNRAKFVRVQTKRFI